MNYRVDISRPKFNNGADLIRQIDFMKQHTSMVAWCDLNISAPWGTDEQGFYFYFEQDAFLFAIRWGNGQG